MKKACLAILLGTAVFYFPILMNPSLLLSRGNDLEEVFWPVFYFIRDNFLSTGTIPLWNNLFLSGTPLLPDPQFSLFYPLNWLFIIFPTDLAFIIYFFVHTFLAGLGIFHLARTGFKLSYYSSLFTALLYVFMPKAAGFVESGHYGLLATLTWTPYLILSIVKLIKNPQIKWSILLSISLAGLFYTHTIIFIINTIFCVVFFGIMCVLEKKLLLKSFVLFILGAFLTFGLTAITLLPQMEWAPSTTRFLLLKDRDVYPKWTGKAEFLKIAVTPWVFSPNELQKIDSEKWLLFGSTTSMLALLGFWQISRKLKIIISLNLLFILLIVLNNASPIYPLLISQDWFVLMRVSTRLWIIVVLITTLLAGYGFDYLIELVKNKKVIILIAFLTLIESLLLVYIRLETPVKNNDAFVPDGVYEFISKDKDLFRVYCTTRCIPQKQAAIHHLELVDGYNTLQQKNFYQQAWQLTGGYWNYYTLSIPPVGLYTFDKLQPDAKALGEYNTKYIISPYLLISGDLEFEKQIGLFNVYKNKAFKPRTYLADKQGNVILDATKITFYTPNEINVDITESAATSLVMANVFSKGWQVYLNGQYKSELLETPSRISLVNINPETKNAIFKYEPESFKIGRIISLVSLIILLTLLKKW